MKDKIKKFFSKDNLFIWICTILLALFVAMSVIFLKKDVEDNKNKQSDISFCDSEINLNTSWTINRDGNLVGDNLYSGDPLSRSSSGTAYYGTITGFFAFVLNNTYSIGFLNSGSYDIIIELRDGSTITHYVSISPGGYNGFSFTASSLNYILNVYFAGENIAYPFICLGDTLLPYEPYGVWYSESNYDNVNEQLQLQSDVNKYGWLSYIDNVDLKVNNTNVREFTFNELKSENYIGADGSFNLLTLSMYNNPNYNNVSIDIYFANSIINSDTLPINLFNVSTKDGFNGTITIRDSDNQVVVLNVQDVTNITYENILSANSEFNNEIYNVEFNFVSPDSATLIFANSNYSFGFQSGFNKGYNVSYNNLSDTINNLNSQVSTLTTNYNNLNSQYETLSTNYVTLLDQYNLISQNEYTFSELFWSISSVPFGVLASGFNVNVLGVNLAAIITGLFTALLIIWIIKKFLK